MERKFKAALFDLDGTLIDTEDQYTVVWGRIARKYRPDIPDLEYIIKGTTLTNILATYFSPETHEAVIKELDAFEAQMDYTYIDGLEAFIRDLHEHGVKTAVVTSSNVPKMESVYKARPDFKELFNEILTSEDFAESKPSPDCYLRGAARFGAKPEECVVLEDSFNGLKSGKAAGMFVVGLTTTNKKEDIKSLSNIQIKDYQDINYQTLKKLWQDI